jgi:hypothetical protein
MFDAMHRVERFRVESSLMGGPRGLPCFLHARQFNRLSTRPLEVEARKRADTAIFRHALRSPGQHEGATPGGEKKANRRIAGPDAGGESPQGDLSAHLATMLQVVSGEPPKAFRASRNCYWIVLSIRRMSMTNHVVVDRNSSA